MPQLGPLEILVVAVVALIVFGPDRLPEIARNIGKAASELRRMANDARSEFTSAFDDEDDEPLRTDSEYLEDESNALETIPDEVDVDEDSSSQAPSHQADAPDVPPERPATVPTPQNHSPEPRG